MQWESGVCLVCQSTCNRDCDVCTRAICRNCDDKIHKEIKIEEQKNQQSCQWCIGTTDIDKFCNWCINNLDVMLANRIKLGSAILLKIYGTPDITRKMVQNKSKMFLVCSCFSGIKCACIQDANNQIRRKYGIADFKILDYAYPGWDPHHDTLGSICTMCKKL